jgi:protein-S-isoprenylcysteine O-methyltransferase Ste14
MTALTVILAQPDLRQLFTPSNTISASWLIFLAYWLVSAFRRKRTKSRESVSQRLSYVIPLVLVWILFSRGAPQMEWLYARFVPDTLGFAWMGAALTVAGIAIACWARYHLGENWSGTVTLKENHELIRTGPYRNIRHPIYTGILLALLGTAIALGEVRGIIAVGIAWASFYSKARREESFLAREFGDRFTEHQRHTGMFLPSFLSGRNSQL